MSETRDSSTTRIRLGRLLFCLIILCLSLGTANGVAANPADPDSTKVAAEKHSSGGRFFPPKLSAWGWIYLPRPYYSSKRGFGFGGQILRKFRWPAGESSPKASNIRFKGRITTKGQSEAESVLNLRWGGGTYYLRTKVNFRSLALRFYGVGPDTPLSNEEVYRPERVLAYIEFFRKVFLQLKVGLRYEYEYFKLVEYKQGGLLDTERIQRSTRKRISGAGVLLDWDTRDREYSPRSGSHHQFFALWFDDELGSEHDFNNYNLDLRNYFSLSPRQVLASQFFIYAAKGSPPFWRLAALGGRDHTRGYRRGRLLDRILLAFQGEYRTELKWRFGLVGFAGMGCVTRQLKDIKLTLLRPSAGAGIRFKIGSDNGIRARFDVAVGDETARLYLALDEAF